MTHNNNNSTITKNNSIHQDVPSLLKRGNVGLIRLLLAVYNAGPQGIATYNVLRQLGSTHHGQDFLKRAEREGLIKRTKGESRDGHFAPVYNTLTDKGIELIQSLIVAKG